MGESELAAGSDRVAKYRVVRIAASGERELLHESAHPIAEVALDSNGGVAWLRRREGDGYAIVRAASPEGERVAARCQRLEVCTLLGSADGARAAWLYGSLGGDLNRLLRLGEDGRISTVHADPRGVADLDETTFDRAGGDLWLTSYRSRRAETYPIAPAAKSAWERLSRALSGADLRLQIGCGAGARWLVEERSDRLQLPRWHLYDPGNGALREIFADVVAAATKLPSSALARRIQIDWRASDGRMIRGFLSVPPGVDLARAPLVARAHGGPWNHAGPGYDPWVQLLVARGFAVFEPNFRGSTGHGRAYVAAAGQEFGAGRVQRDIVDGVRHLLAIGVGDPARVGIAGASFGGDSALLGVTWDPELFRVAIAAAPPTDFGWTTRYFAERERPERASEMPLAPRLRQLGLDPSDKELAERMLHRHLGGAEPSSIAPALAESMRRNLRSDGDETGRGGLVDDRGAGKDAPRDAG